MSDGAALAPEDSQHVEADALSLPDSTFFLPPAPFPSLPLLPPSPCTCTCTCTCTSPLDASRGLRLGWLPIRVLPHSEALNLLAAPTAAFDEWLEAVNPPWPVSPGG